VISRRHALTSIALGLTAGCVTSNATTPLAAATAAEARLGFAGAVLVAQRGVIRLDEVHGAVRGQPVRRESRFWISSMGKQFISAAIMRCADLGYLRVDQTLAEIWPDTPADKGAVTVRQVLSHTSGLPQSYDFEVTASSDEARASILTLSLEAAPGDHFIYSNANYALAAAIIERASGGNYAAFVRAQLLDRAGLHDTGQFPNNPEPHVEPIAGETPPVLGRLRWWQAYYSTAHDLYRWRQALWSDRIISASARTTLLSPVAPIQEGQAALGWFIGTAEHGATRIFVRGNDDTGQNSLIYYYPQTDTTIIVLTHAGYKDDETSWSRAMLASLEAALSL
jgi:CubicO group peptidase (beta-lactamase class C family)